MGGLSKNKASSKNRYGGQKQRGKFTEILPAAEEMIKFADDEPSITTIRPGMINSAGKAGQPNRLKMTCEGTNRLIATIQCGGRKQAITFETTNLVEMHLALKEHFPG